MLEEMGIAPIWRLRTTSARLEPADVSDDTAPTQPPERPAAMVPAAEPVVSQSADIGSEERRQQILQMDWAALKASVAQCIACPLHAKRTNTVFGVGDEQADWLFVGEGPGAEEDAKGEPFVGQAGRLLDNMLLAIDLVRGANVYIANVVKCRPPGNRDPLPEETGACSHWLDDQQAILNPKAIVTLGRYSLARFLPGTPIGKIHGQGRKVGDVWVVPMYHPAAALHQGSLRATIENDFRRIPQYLEAAKREEAAKQPEPVAAAPAAPDVTQGKLF